MKIRCWGSRGSIAVSGSEYVKYGGETTCMEIRSEQDDVIVVDAGTGIRALGNCLTQQHHTHINLLFSHVHLDHLVGLPFFSPMFNAGVSVHIRGCPFDAPSYEHLIRGMMIPPYFPVTADAFQARLTYTTIDTTPFTIGPITITPVYISHPNKGLGFKFQEGDATFVFITDNELSYIHDGGLGFEEYVSFCKGCDVLIHDAEYSKDDYNKYFGHSQYTDTVKLAVRAGVKKLGLFHLNRENTDAHMDRMVEHARELIAKSDAPSMECVAVGTGFSLHVT
jgi:phosphoribosyl 1,2-cyclic phosphodiesterase